MSDGIVYENKTKFDCYIKTVLESDANFDYKQEYMFDKLRLFRTIKTFNEFQNFKNHGSKVMPAGETSANVQKYMNHHLPKLLNQIRLTNFSNEYNDIKTLLSERHQKHHQVKTATNYYDDPYDKTSTYNAPQDYIWLVTSLYELNEQIKTDDVEDDKVCEKIEESERPNDSKEKEPEIPKVLTSETVNLTKLAEIPDKISVLEASLNFFVTNPSPEPRLKNFNTESPFSLAKSKKGQAIGKSESNPQINYDSNLIAYAGDLHILSNNLLK